MDARKAKLIATLDHARDVLTPSRELHMLLTFEPSDVFSSTLPPSGMTHDGLVYELPMPALRTPDIGYSSLPTPRVAATRTGRSAADRSSSSPSLDQALELMRGELPREFETDDEMPSGWRLLKTPTSQLAIHGGSQHPDKRKVGGHGPTLADEVEHLLPTPAVVMNDGESLDSWEARRDRVKATKVNGNGMGTPLPIALLQLERGDHTPLPSPAGKASSDG